MARPPRHTVDYFPHYIADGKKMFIVESMFGNDGYATWFKIIETLAKTEDHWIDLQEDSTRMFLAAKCRIDEATLIKIIDSIVKLGEIDGQLWDSQQIIWCQRFVDSVEDAYRKRSNECMTKEGLLEHLMSLGRNIRGLDRSEVAVKPQTKEEYSKEEKSKPKEKSSGAKAPTHTKQPLLIQEDTPLMKWVKEHTPKLLKFKRPLTNDECIKLYNDFGLDDKVKKEAFKNMLENIENRTGVEKKNESANLTIRNWWRRNSENQSSSNVGDKVVVKIHDKEYSR